MLSLSKSYPTPPHAARVQVIGPHFEKIFLPDRWNPFHVLKAPDTGKPHCHPYDIVANILLGGYVEDVWVLLDGGGYTLHHDVERLPGTTHRIDAQTIHLITRLPLGFSITEAEPTEARRDWFFYFPQEDGSVLRSPHFDGPWEPFHPAGPVTHEYHQGPPPAPQRKPRAKRPALAEEPLPDLGFVIGPNNTWEAAWLALKAGHQVRMPDWHPHWSWVLMRDTQEIVIVKGNDSTQWGANRNPCYDWVSAKMMLATNWIVLPKIDIIPPTI